MTVSVVNTQIANAVADPNANKLQSVADEPTSTVNFYWKGEVKKGKSKLDLELCFGVSTRVVYHLVPPEQNTKEYKPVKVEERTYREVMNEKGAYKIISQYEKLSSLSLKIDQLAKLYLVVTVLAEYGNHCPEIRCTLGMYAEQISKPTLENGVEYDLFINSADLELEAQLKVHEKTTTSPTPTTTTAPQPTKKQECIIA